MAQLMPATFNIQPLSRFAGASTTIRRPREFCYFSYDEEHRLHPLSDISLRYYYPPFFNAPGKSGSQQTTVDLSEGFDSFRKHDDKIDEHLDSLLDTLAAHEQKEDDVVKADIVTWRGMMTKIMTVPFDHFSDFEMNATCYQGTIYIEENKSYKAEEEMRRRPDRPGQPSQALMQYWGYKFETLSVLDKPWGEASREIIERRHQEVVSNEAQYCSIVRTGIGGSSLIIGGEVDAVMGAKPVGGDDPIPWIELKTSQQPVNDKDWQKYERKLLKFWAQSFLLGVPRIIVGFRSPNGKLLNLQELETQKIPSTVKRQGMQSWDGNTCINFAASFLDFLKRTVTGTAVWRIQRRQKDDVIRVFPTETTLPETILKPSFKQHRDRLLARQAAGMLGKKRASES